MRHKDGDNKMEKVEKAKLTYWEAIKKEASIQAKLAKKHKGQYMLVLPYYLVFFTFTILPVIISIYLSFTYFNILEPPTFIGIQNYYRLFVEDRVFIESIRNTIVFAVATGPISYLLALFMAWLINDRSRLSRVIFTIFFYAPSLTGGLVFIMHIIFSSDAHGFLNAFLLRWGFISEPVLWLINVDVFPIIIIFVVLWGSLGATFLAFVAGLQGIDRQYYEAGAIDGIRNRWQELWFITLPLMKPQLMFGAVLSITASFGIGAVITDLVGFPSPEYAAHTITLHLHDFGGLRFEMGYASAIATVLFIIMIVCNKSVKKLLNKVGT